MFSELGHFCRWLPWVTSSRPRIWHVNPPPNRRAQYPSRSSAAATMTLATSPYACAQVSARSGVHGMPEELLQVSSRLPPTAVVALSHHREATVITAPVAEEGHHVVELVDVSRPQGTGRPPACRAAPISGSKHRAQLRVPQGAGANRKYSGTSSQAATTFPQLAFRAAVSIRLRATEIRRSRARWRRPPQSP
jgi:hypothetical protein